MLDHYERRRPISVGERRRNYASNLLKGQKIHPIFIVGSNFSSTKLTTISDKLTRRENNKP